VANKRVQVFSPSAMHSSLEALAAAHRERGGDEVALAFETAPAFVKRLETGQQADVLIATPSLMKDLLMLGKVHGDSRLELGRVGVGVVVRKGAPRPDISTTRALTAALHDAESIVYNRASSGMYVETLIAKLGLAEALARKTVRYHDAQESFTHLQQDHGREVGFGGLTEIARWRDRGLVLVGPLPPDIQNFTLYIAALATAATNEAGGRAFLDFLGTADARAILTDRGVIVP
jgi:molybdate transport system substrate-binding protein